MPRRFFLAAIAAVTAFALVPAGAGAFTEPPPSPKSVLVFPDRDFVSVSGYGQNKNLAVRVIRNGVVIGSAVGTSDNSPAPDNGIFEVNHPGGECWIGSTPDILPGDKVVVGSSLADPNADATTTGNIHASAAVIERDPVTNARTGRVVVTGTAFNVDGSPMDLALVEQRVINPDLVDTEVNKREVRAVLGDGLEPLLGVPGGWMAVYDQYSDETDDVIVAGDTRGMSWQATAPNGDRLGITIHEVGAVGGPGVAGCPAAASYAVTGSDHPAVTKAMKDAATDLVLSGVSQDATNVKVTLSDGTPARDAVVDTIPTPATGAQTWSVTIKAADLAKLNDGPLTASGIYTVGSAITGATLSLAKDTVAPGPPSATPSPGTYPSAQSVSLHDGDATAAIHWTNNGTDPTGFSPRSASPINVTASQTIKAVTIDGVGNASSVASFAYVIQPPAGNGTGTGGQPAATPVGTGAAAAAAASQTRPVVAGILVGAAARPSLATPLTDRTISRATLRARGLRLILRLRDAQTVRVAIYRLVGGRRSGAPVLVISRPVKSSGVMTLRLTGRSLMRALRPGSYEAAVRPSAGATNLGSTKRVRFRVVR